MVVPDSASRWDRFVLSHPSELGWGAHGRAGSIILKSPGGGRLSLVGPKHLQWVLTSTHEENDAAVRRSDPPDELH